MTTTDQDRAAALAAKAEDQRKRDTIKRANIRTLREMPSAIADRVRANADAAMNAARANGDRSSSVYFLRDAILAENAQEVPAVAEGETLTCRTCGQDKPLSEMPKHRRGKNGTGQCRPCYNAQWKTWNASKAASK
jgi:hypothetical protein